MFHWTLPINLLFDAVVDSMKCANENNTRNKNKQRCKAPLKLVLWSVCVCVCVRVCDHLTRECNNKHKNRRFMSMCEVFSIRTNGCTNEPQWMCIMSCTVSVSYNQHSTTNIIALKKKKKQRQLNGSVKEFIQIFEFGILFSLKLHDQQGELTEHLFKYFQSCSCFQFKCTFQFKQTVTQHCSATSARKKNSFLTTTKWVILFQLEFCYLFIHWIVDERNSSETKNAITTYLFNICVCLCTFILCFGKGIFVQITIYFFTYFSSIHSFVL